MCPQEDLDTAPYFAYKGIGRSMPYTFEYEIYTPV